MLVIAGAVRARVVDISLFLRLDVSRAYKKHIEKALPKMSPTR